MPVRTIPRRSQAPAQQEANSRLLGAPPTHSPPGQPRPTRTTARLRRLSGKPTELSGRMPVRTTPRRSQAPAQWQVYLSPWCPDHQPPVDCSLSCWASARGSWRVKASALVCKGLGTCMPGAAVSISGAGAVSAHSPTSHALGAWCWHVLCKYGTQKSRTRWRGASWESVGRSEVRAEGSGVMPQDCSNVSGTRGSRNDAALTSYNPSCPF